MKKYDGLPGVDEDDDEIVNRRPDSITTKPHALFGKVMLKRAKYFEGKKEYWHCRHVYAVIKHMWPAGSYESVEAEKAHRRDAMRSF